MRRVLLGVELDDQLLLGGDREARPLRALEHAARERLAIQAAMDQASRGAPLAWIAVDRESFSGRMLERPSRPSIPIAAQEQLVVELYSK